MTGHVLTCLHIPGHHDCKPSQNQQHSRLSCKAATQSDLDCSENISLLPVTHGKVGPHLHSMELRCSMNEVDA